MFKRNDVVIICKSYAHEEDVSYRVGDVCIILDIYEGGKEIWSGRDVGESYRVLNKRTGETIYLDDTVRLKHYGKEVCLKHYSELYDKPYDKESELIESRKKAFLEWIDGKKKDSYKI